MSGRTKKPKPSQASSNETVQEVQSYKQSKDEEKIITDARNLLKDTQTLEDDFFNNTNMSFGRRRSNHNTRRNRRSYKKKRNKKSLKKYHYIL